MIQRDKHLSFHSAKYLIAQLAKPQQAPLQIFVENPRPLLLPSSCSRDDSKPGKFSWPSGGSKALLRNVSEERVVHRRLLEGKSQSKPKFQLFNYIFSYFFDTIWFWVSAKWGWCCSNWDYGLTVSYLESTAWVPNTWIYLVGVYVCFGCRARMNNRSLLQRCTWNGWTRVVSSYSSAAVAALLQGNLQFTHATQHI